MVSFSFLKPLYHLGPIEIPSYFLFLTLAILAAAKAGIAEGKRRGMDEVALLDLSAVLPLSGLLGARLLHAIAEEPAYYFEHFWDHPFRLLQIWNGGFAYLGGLILALPVGIAFARWRKLNIADAADASVYGFALGSAIGRIGCHLAGCCFGKPWDGPLSIVYRAADGVAPQVIFLKPEYAGRGLYPTQLLLAAMGLAVFLWLKWYRSRQRFKGELLLHFIMGYSLLRFPIEYLRDDVRGTVLGGALSTSQGLSLLLFSGAMLCWIAVRRKIARAHC